VTADAVGAVTTFLERMAALRDSPNRKATRKADHAALRGLTERGIGQALFDRLSELVAAASVEADQVEEWSTVARAVIKRRDYLIRLGLGSPHARRGAAPVGTAVPPRPVTTAPPAPQEEEEAVPPSRAA
jgi:hypothetical protein